MTWFCASHCKPSVSLHGMCQIIWTSCKYVGVCRYIMQRWYLYSFQLIRRMRKQCVPGPHFPPLLNYFHGKGLEMKLIISATVEDKSSFKAVWMPRIMSGRASIHEKGLCWAFRAAFSWWWNRSTMLLDWEWLGVAWDHFDPTRVIRACHNLDSIWQPRSITIVEGTPNRGGFEQLLLSLD